jgi:hypothetical protein
MSNKRLKSDFLFAQPSFLTGFARGLDLGGTFDDYNSSADEATADLRAVAADWTITGTDLKDAIESDSKKAA